MRISLNTLSVTLLTVPLVMFLGTLLLPTPAMAGTFTTNTTIKDARYDGTYIIVNGCTVTIDGEHSFTSLKLINGGIVTADSQKLMTLHITTDVTVDATSRIDLSGAGYPCAAGPGVGGSNGSFGGGGAHGGNGGSGNNGFTTSSGGVGGYDNPLAPTDFGSGAGYDNYENLPGGAGGGALRLIAGGTVTVNGQLLANGTYGTSDGSGGAGGSLYLTVGTLAGSGTIAAIGGNAGTSGNYAYGDGGGGGCIAVEFATKNFSGSISTIGGIGYQYGGAGTIYTIKTSVSGKVGALLIGNNGTAGALTPVAVLSTPPDVTVTNYGYLYPTVPLTVNSLSLVSYGHVVSPNGNVNFTILGNASIDGSSDINVTGSGYACCAGPGVGGSDGSFGGGGAHGGNGGSGNVGGYTASSGGTSYDNPLAPNDFGSGAGYDTWENRPGGAGGGTVRMIVSGTLTVNGQLLASGADGSSDGSGGAGGSLYLTVGTLIGSGTIAANGGNAGTSGNYAYGDGGGGGRISIEYAVKSYNGNISAIGGIGYQYGGAGTIYTIRIGNTGALLVNNGGNAGALTPMAASASLLDITVTDNAFLYPIVPVSVNSLMLINNGYIVSPNGRVNITVQGNASVDATSAINVTGAGYPCAQGPGVGGSDGSFGGGGAHGGNGGSGSNGYTPSSGGGAYDNPLAPTDFGSGAGFDNYENRPGGAGGGAVRLIVNGTLTINGQLLANGVNGSVDSAGGAGGSLYLTVGILTGGGIISANGGDGGTANSTLSDGGGGGRIALEYQADTFIGNLSAIGGIGYQCGGAGTIYTVQNGQTPAYLVSNGGTVGALTPLSTAITADVIVANGGYLIPTVSQSFHSLTLTSGYLIQNGTSNGNSLIVLGNMSIDGGSHIYSQDGRVNFTVQGDATFATGSEVNVSGAGYASGTGPGVGGSEGTFGGGGAHGGNGGSGCNGFTPSSGGIAYDDPQAPTDFGSGAGYDYWENHSGGAGGGAIRIIVNGTCTVNGQLVATGTDGWSDASGGAGGSLYLTVGALTGSGSCSANGGNGGDSGNYAYGDGGGGGRIAVEYTTNTFTGNYSAIGGKGYQYGGAGTYYTAQSGKIGRLTLDNGGNLGERTPLAVSTATDIIVTNNAILYSPAPVTINSLTLLNNGHVWGSNGRVDITTSTDASIDATSDINVTGVGYAGGAGPGAGGSDGAFGGGGAHGGNGGSGCRDGYTPSSAGIAYDNPLSPTDFGSGAGYDYWENHSGGAGGGAVRIIVNGTLTCDGQILATGTDGWSDSSGGAGGSLFLTAGTFAGSGSVAANGGNAGTSGNYAYGDGGGGGRIAVEYTTDTFTGTISAIGGIGYQYGGAGTIYTVQNGQVGSLRIDNGGNIGAKTPLTSAIASDVTVANSAILYPSIAESFNSLTLASGYLTQHGTATGISLTVLGNMSADSGSHIQSEDGRVAITVQGDATIASGCDINLSGAGYSGGSGPGAGPAAYNGAAGAHGGNGGAECQGVPGGTAYDSFSAPTDFGSGGGLDTEYGRPGASGGGAVRLIVNGILTLNGSIEVNGSNHVSYEGPGAGGSLYLTVGTFAGGGTLNANGGNAVNGWSGGGGGGRIAVEYGTNNFTGGMSAIGGYCAGNGGEYGGAGTVYTIQNGKTGALLIANGGTLGALTPLSLAVSPDVTVANSAHVLPTIAETFNSLTLTSGYLTQQGTANGISLTVTGNMSADGGSHVLSQDGHIAITVNGDASFATGSDINVTGEGYVGGTGPGAGVPAYNGAAGAHGGNGGAECLGVAGGTAYGSITAPIEFGSGGGQDTEYGTLGAAGGGAIRLIVNGQLTLNGAFIANGADHISYEGPGAGGSLYLTVGSLTGAGSLSADGGNAIHGYSGGGGGGRIAVEYGTTTFTGAMDAVGGATFSGGQYGGAGTIYTVQNGQTGDLLVSNGGTSGAFTALTVAFTGNVAVANSANLFSIVAQTFKSLTLTSANLTQNGTANGVSLTVLGNMSVDSNSHILSQDGRVAITVKRDAIFATGSDINLSGAGYAGSTGPGAGPTGYNGTGGAHGGNGGASYVGQPGGTAYDNITAPTDFGSGGGLDTEYGTPGAAGGGAVRIIVNGMLTLNGTILTNGSDNWRWNGAGAGGSVYISANTVTGNGTLAANGGNASYGGYSGAGGGGRIAVEYGTNTFTGAISAMGGYSSNGGQFGGAGTIYLKPTSGPGALSVTNGGTAGAATPIGTIPLLSTLSVLGGTQLVPIAGAHGLTLQATGNATVDALSNILVSGSGFTGDAGPGAGGDGNPGGAGAGYGGAGGNSAGGAVGGDTYGSGTFPYDPGSGGGQDTGGAVAGGAGGGALNLVAGGTLQLDGNLYANGNSGSSAGNGGGGGAGGGIFLLTPKLIGAGSIHADGGNAGNISVSGGGGGGRVALYAGDVSQFNTNQITVNPGLGYQNGGVGTINQTQAWSLALITSLTSPTAVGMPVTLTAVSTKTGNLQYKFFATYTDVNSVLQTVLIKDYSASSSVSWTPAVAATYTLTVYARVKGETVAFDAQAAVTYTVNPAISALAFTASPTPVAAGRPVALSAIPTGGGTLDYKFFAQYTDANKVIQTVLIQDYSTINTASWTPTIPATYTVIVYARERGATGLFSLYRATTVVVKPALSAVSLVASLVAPTAVGMPVKLTAAPTGGNVVEYQFSATYLDANQTLQSVLIRDFATTASVIWSPALATSYTVTVYAREKGETVAYDALASISGYAVNPAISALSLATTLSAPTAVSITVGLSATATGGGTLDYKFFAQYTDSNVKLQTVLIQDYSPVNTASWTPTLPATYTVIVYARERGVTSAYSKSAYISNYTVKPAMSALTLAASLTAPTSVGSSVKLTATATKGGTLEYQFVATYLDANQTLQTVLIQDFAKTSTVTWAPALATTYTLTVNAREKGKTVAFDLQASLTNYAVNPAISALTLSHTLNSPTAVGMSVGLSATATNGGTLDYKFLAQYTDANQTLQTVTIQDYSTATTAIWAPNVPATYSIIVYARERGVTAAYSKYAYVSNFMVKPELSALSLTPSLTAPILLGAKIGLTSIATGGGTLDYKFFAQYTDANQTLQTVLIKDYSTTSTVNWTPSLPATYTIIVYARERGVTAAYSKYAYVSHYAVKPVVSALALASSLTPPTAVGASVKLTATATGGALLEYKFFASYIDSNLVQQTVLIQDYSPASLVSWVPSTAANYTVTAYAREQGTTVAYAVQATVTGFIVNPAISALTLVSPSSGTVNQPLALSATATGGGTLDYKFFAQYTDVNKIVQTILIQDYNAINTASWTPSLAANYTVIVYARERGSTAQFSLYKAVSVKVQTLSTLKPPSR